MNKYIWNFCCMVFDNLFSTEKIVRYVRFAFLFIFICRKKKATLLVHGRIDENHWGRMKRFDLVWWSPSLADLFLSCLFGLAFLMYTRKKRTDIFFSFRKMKIYFSPYFFVVLILVFYFILAFSSRLWKKDQRIVFLLLFIVVVNIFYFLFFFN